MKLALILIVISLALSSSGFQPVSDGDILWLSTLTNGGYVLVTYNGAEGYQYIKVTYMDGREYTSSEDLLPGIPSQISVSGCGKYVTVAVHVGDTVYVSRTDISGYISCGPVNSVYIPILSNP